MVPSEVLTAILSRSEHELLYDRKEMNPKTLEHLEKCEAGIKQKLIALVHLATRIALNRLKYVRGTFLVCQATLHYMLHT